MSRSWVVSFFLLSTAWGGDAPPLPIAEGVVAPVTNPELSLVAIRRRAGRSGGEVWVAEREGVGAEPSSGTNQVAFRAVAGRNWPPGLVPVFAVESKGGFELRRLPTKGRENFTDPLFFAWPLEDEPAARQLAGRWTVQSKSEQGNQRRLAFEFAVDGERVSGRFDQDTDYRFAYITGGTWSGQRLELAAEYINDRYSMQGTWREGRLTGEWQQLPEGDRGVWEATRPATAAVPPPDGLVPLYEWRRESDGARRYTVETEPAEPGWERAKRPLARVWRP